jgi:hypothetical protein
MCQRGNCPFSNLKISKIYKLIAFLKTLQRLKQEWQKSLALEPGKQMAKLGLFWRNRKKVSQISNAYLCLPLLTVLPLNYFMPNTYNLLYTV